MPTGRSRLLGLLAATALLAPGCSQSGPFTSRTTTLGSLKASVSQLEFDNEKLQREVADLKADNARLDNQLAQEREANSEVTARLDDAKELLRRQGGDTQALGIPSKNFEDDGIPPPATRPPSRRPISRRKPPAAQIRRPEPASSDDHDGRAFDSTSTDRPRDIGPDGPEDDRWLPVARGLGRAVRR